MNTLTKLIYTLLLTGLPLTASAANPISARNVDVRIAGGFLNLNAEIILDSLRLSSDRQVFVTPVVKASDSQVKEFPSILVNGRNMHISYERGTLNRLPALRSHSVAQEVRRLNGKPQSLEYAARVPMEEWMGSGAARVLFVYDSCGCGASYGSALSDGIPVFSNPVKQMRVAMLTPSVTEIPVQIHNGKARVQFEVNRTELHDSPYRCKNGRVIDNRAEIAVIDDSVRYALTDPNVEIAGIEICGYASPESPYTHNDLLATGRSKALADYLTQRYSLPEGSVRYSAVAENWDEFRREAQLSNEISEAERTALLELIDTPASSPDEYDRKEKILKTDPKFRKLYQSLILPEWFPRLRATTFAIQTRLKPMDDQALAEVIKTSPEKMSLNQMFRVARLYPEGSPEFDEVISTALRYYPTDPTAILNAAAAEIRRGEYSKAKSLLDKAGENPQTYNLLGIIATAEEDYDLARRYFGMAGDLPEAKRNLGLLK